MNNSEDDTKNVIIAILIIGVCVIGYFLYQSNQKSTQLESSVDDANSQAQSASDAASEASEAASDAQQDAQDAQDAADEAQSQLDDME